MPLYIHDALFSKMRLLGNIFSSIAYGIVIVLSVNCLHLLQQKRGIYSNRMRVRLLIYVIFMLLCSTWTILRSIWVCVAIMTQRTPTYIEYFPFESPLAMWGADGFMIWRCLILYQDVSRGHRVMIIVLLSALSFASFGWGVALLVDILSPNWKIMEALTYAQVVFISLSTPVNIILAVLIVFRLVYLRRYVRNALGVEHGSPYTNIITMCIESSALMVVASSLYTILFFMSMDEILILNVIPHICAISPLLTVYRVALGRAIPPTLLPSEQVMAQIRVNIPLSNPPIDSQEGEV